ncbi:DNA-processing protein DprA [Labrys wisconsinensis]|uniref:DNA processing protein n=1 Tax=Labrys wisconsinensis TaxID=425677 RepID=A0ABU0J357_9HYPH|nr:DNA-processing protein DprA [Labrys wisconsinensis]MDQ0468698.1 DNA processing protein [Labrys wisconsinensis]
MTQDGAPRPALTEQQRLDWLRLIRSESIGPPTFKGLMQRFGSARAALEALPRLAGRPARIASETEALREMEAMARLGARFVALGEPDYPPALQAVDGAPPLLAVRGDTAALMRPMVAVVGSRNASALGRRFAATLAHGLGEAGFVVVSGLARGIDAAAHAAALDGGTVAALAGGLDRIYPREHGELAARIAETGCLVSERPLGHEATARDFPRRNRIVSGLAYGVVVVEAALRSGSLITARLANEQGREVFAVPGSPLDPRAEGTNQLIRQGATLITGVADVLEALRPLVAAGPPAPMPGHPGAAVEADAEAADWENEPALPLEAAPAVASGRETLLALLGPSPVSIDDLARASRLALREVQLALVELDLEGRIERHGGNRISLR